jgi:hypothetical protein
VKINEKGQCLVCLVKPTPYKRDGHYFCTRCDRSYDLITGDWQENSFWEKYDEPTRTHLFYGEPRYANPVYWVHVDEHPGANLPSAIFYKMKREKQIAFIEPNKPANERNKKFEEWMKGWNRFAVRSS